jgi:hypothetical protein
LGQTQPTKEAIWLHQLLEELSEKGSTTTRNSLERASPLALEWSPIASDNQGAIALATLVITEDQSTSAVSNTLCERRLKDRRLGLLLHLLERWQQRAEDATVRSDVHRV